MIGIYKITNKINNKCYIGQSIDIKKRFNGHKNSENNKYLKNAFKKYGINNFIFEVIEECKMEELNEKEIYYIKLYKSMNRKYGYNLSPGGTGKAKKTSLRTRRLISKNKKGKSTNRTPEKEKQRIEKYKKAIANMPKEKREKWLRKKSKIHKGKVVTQEQREKISKTLKEYFKDENARKHLSEIHKGRKASLMTRLKMSMTRLKIQKDISKQFAKRVLQYDLSDNLIGTFDSVNELKRKFGYSTANISACCNGKRKTAHGFKWKYDEEFNKKYRREKNRNGK